ncbi:SAC3/GANP/Nin1/mts3/eIF-3 p25 family-domain-containing protein [Sporodiniella umbellata]|nr:SAC3/GANP/Nin1/mts3/eIF-3 p25 family-domain-containing protein [Sporodiniella umbellata]
MLSSNTGKARGPNSAIFDAHFRNRNENSESKNFDKALGEVLFKNRTAKGKNRTQNNKTYKPGSITTNRPSSNRKQVSYPTVTENPPKKIHNQAQAERAARFGSSSKSEIYAQLKRDRITEREQAIKCGLIPDPNTPRRLEDAIDFRGTCQTKCPHFEMVERDIQNGVDRLEMDEEGNLDKNKAVKAYRRSAAGNDQPLPTDVRSPEALVATLDYLMNDILSVHTLEKCHAFIRDRTRSIRQDFTLQNIRDVTAIQVHERIARFHILCLHEMCGMEESKFSEQQETEQLRKVLLSLMEFYEDLREEGIETPNEPEFRSYYILTHIRDKDVAKQTMSQPINIFKHQHVQLALKFHAMAQRSNEIEETSSRRNKASNALASKNSYSSFFKWIKHQNTPFLMACLLETHFAEVRKGALKAMNVGYLMRAAGVEASYVQNILCYDSLIHCLQEARHYGIAMDMSLGEPTLLFGQRHYETRVHVFLAFVVFTSKKIRDCRD